MLKLRRGEGPFYSRARRVAKAVLTSNFPVPLFLKPFYRSIYNLHYTIKYGFIRLLTYFYYEPAFRARCTEVGRNLQLWAFPHVDGHAKIYIGDNVSIYGHMGIGSGRIYDEPVIRIGNGVDIGHNVFFTVNQEVIVEDHVNIASFTHILDSDSHPRDPVLRARKLPPSRDEIKPIRICTRAWIGMGSFIMKGVTIGEGAIVGSNSVVISDVPAFSVVLGNPARVIVKDTRMKTDTTPSVELVRSN